MLWREDPEIMMDLPNFFEFQHHPMIKMEPNNNGHYLMNPFSGGGALGGGGVASGGGVYNGKINGVSTSLNGTYEECSQPFINYSQCQSGSQSQRPFKPERPEPLMMTPPALILPPPSSSVNLQSGGIGGIGGGCSSFQDEERSKLLNGQVPVLKLKRITENGHSNKLRNGGVDGGDIGGIQPENLIIKEEPQDINEEVDVSLFSTDSESSSASETTSDEDEDASEDEEDDKHQALHNPSIKPKISSRAFMNPSKLKTHPGHYQCNFCPVVREYAPELALHESQDHSQPRQIIGASIDLKKHSSIKRRYFCARCPLAILGRQQYINHHLKEHLNLEVSIPKPSSKKQTPFETYPCDICSAPLSKDNQYSKKDHFRSHHNLKGTDPSTIERCDLCPAYFLRGIQLLKHKQVLHGTLIIDPKTNTKRHLCQSCNKFFSTLPSLWSHRRDLCDFRHNFTFPFTCSLEGCLQKFESTSDLDYHVTNSHSSDKLKGALVNCPTCGRTCMGHFGLITHMQCHSSDSNLQDPSQLQCQICGERLKSRLYFNRHMKRHLSQEQNQQSPPTNQEGAHMCDQCGKTYTNRSCLELHYEFHKDPENWRFTCEVCSKKCSTKQSLQVHMRTHTGEKPYVCQFCGEKYGYRHLLRWHVNQRHCEGGGGGNGGNREEDKPRKYRKNLLGQGGCHLGKRTNPNNTEFVCGECSKSFSTKQALQVHGRLHTGEKPFVCQVCKEQFRYRHFLRIHVNQRHGEQGFKDLARPYRKNSDSGPEGVGGNLPSPSTIGNGEGGEMDLNLKPMPVSVSSQQQDLQHQGPDKISKGFECPQCSKSFSTKQSMQVHLRVHTGEKPFGCEVCGERFRYRHVLRSHVNSRHEMEGIRDVPRPYNRRVSKITN